MLFAKFIRYSALLLTLLVAGCPNQPRGENEIIIGTIAGPESELMEVAKHVAERDHDLKVKIVVFEDYIIPNTALAEGDIDANHFQHQPFLDIVVTNKGYDLIPIAKTFIYPMGIYSRKHNSIETAPKQGKIAIPNDPSNGARALRLLAKAKLIEVPDLDDIKLTVKSITNNPLNIKFIEMGAAQLPRALDEVDYAVINTTFALPAGLIPNQDALFLESKQSPYANILVIRGADRDQPKFKKFIAALHSKEVVTKAQSLFHDQAILAW